jgi:uncharacterized protein
MRLAAAAFIVAMAGPETAPAATPSWCDADGLNVSELAICSTPMLGILDQRLNEAHAAARRLGGDIGQVEWLGDRNACGWNVACLEHAYRERIEWLEAIAPAEGGLPRNFGDGIAGGQISVAPLAEPPAPDAREEWSILAPWLPDEPEIIEEEERVDRALPPAIDPAAAALPMLDDMTPRPWCGSTRLNPTERAVCGNPSLSRLDALLELVYGRALARDEDREQLRWLRGERDGCGADVSCIAVVYAGRIEALNRPFARDAARRHQIEIPAGHFPPPGTCRLWHPDRPPGQQPPPTSCDVQVPRGAILIRG